VIVGQTTPGVIELVVAAVGVVLGVIAVSVHPDAGRAYHQGLSPTDIPEPGTTRARRRHRRQMRRTPPPTERR
jgi:hypothetical protein